MIQTFISAIENNVPITIFGCTDFGKGVYGILKSINPKASVDFIDNSVEKQNGPFCNEKVWAIDQKNFGEDNAYYVIASFRYCEEMQAQLIAQNVKKEYIVRPEHIEQVPVIARKMPHQLLKFAVDLAEHCNLNCQGCDHFSPLAEECYTDIHEYEKDMKRLAELFGDKVAQIKLEGGEPLLNSQVVNFIEIAYKYFPQTIISIYTNGTLLLNMDDLFWEICAKYGVDIEITKYPIPFQYELVYEKAMQMGVAVHYFGEGETVKTLRRHPLDLDGKQDVKNNFEHCFLANNCIMLKAGKLHTCTMIPNMKHFKRYFNMNVKVREEDGIDIYKAKTAAEIMKFLSEPAPACRYCKVFERTDGHEWHVSRRSIEEWT